MKQTKLPIKLTGGAFLNYRGEWVPAVPEPYYHLIRKGCECGERFWTDEGYRGHYAFRHINSPEPENLSN